MYMREVIRSLKTKPPKRVSSFKIPQKFVGQILKNAVKGGTNSHARSKEKEYHNAFFERCDEQQQKRKIEEEVKDHRRWHRTRGLTREG
mmetsp:Transcript_52043/g.59438  ORF Transcript_52043/g.59438 Transcript_52043/m.59438 type:complete len:89 (+) Transcript_52043:494-760(+)